MFDLVLAFFFKNSTKSTSYCRNTFGRELNSNIKVVFVILRRIA
jgi:hypothetical protein